MVEACTDLSQWLFVSDWTCTYTGYSSGTTKLKSILKKNQRKNKKSEGESNQGHQLITP